MEAAAKRLQPMAMQIACIPATYNTYQLVSANASDWLLTKSFQFVENVSFRIEGI